MAAAEKGRRTGYNIDRALGGRSAQAWRSRDEIYGTGGWRRIVGNLAVDRCRQGQAKDNQDIPAAIGGAGARCRRARTFRRKDRSDRRLMMLRASSGRQETRESTEPRPWPAF